MEAFLSQRQDVIASAKPGVASAREIARLTDEAVRELSLAASSRIGRGRWAVVTLGGWGSGALLPTSDLDILLLSDAAESKLKPFVEAVLYPLWDAGLKVGHQVRNPRGQLKAMREDLATCTAALTGRPIAGDEEWAGRVLADGAAEARKRRRDLFAQLAARPRPGSPYALEPELKEDAGGRRDYDELVWTAAVACGCVAHDPSGLAEAGLATPQELALVSAAAEVVSTARFELGRAGLGARMTLDSVEALQDVTPAQVQLALAQTALVLTRVRRRAAGERVEADTALSPDALYALFDAGDAALPTLQEAAQAGRLEALVPGFRDLMTLRRPGIGHQLTVGAHSLRATSLLATMPLEGALGRSREAIEHLRTLQVATLVHDIGKSEPGAGHALRGVEPAEEAARRFGLPDSAVQEVGDLVLLHLTLAETATRIDLDDEDAVLLAAAHIAHRELLAPLHLLTAADSMATGPATWSRWTESLVGALVSRLDAALSDDVDGAGIAERAESVQASALAAIPADAAVQRAFVERAPLRYLASRTPADVARDARLAAELERTGAAEQAHIAVGVGPTPETRAVTVVAPDKPELLSRVAGAMALAGLDILSVDAYGSRNGVVLDSFVVASATRRPIGEDTFEQLSRLLSAALRDRLELKTRLAERRRHYPPKQSGPTRVEIASSGWDTTVRVSAPDRPGLLHDLARAVSATGLDIRWAKVLTVDGFAVDTFHVVDADGQMVDDPGVLGHLSMRLREIR